MASPPPVDRGFHGAGVIIPGLIPCPCLASSGDLYELVEKAFVVLIAGGGMHHLVNQHSAHSFRSVPQWLSQANDSLLIGGGGVTEMRRMVEFHTDFTQNNRSRRIILRHREKPETARLSSPNAQRMPNRMSWPAGTLAEIEAKTTDHGSVHPSLRITVGLTPHRMVGLPVALRVWVPSAVLRVSIPRPFLAGLVAFGVSTPGVLS